MIKKITSKSKSKLLGQKIVSTIGSIGFGLLALMHLLFAQGAAGIGIWVQAIPAILAALVFVLSAYKVVEGLRVTPILFFGTLPLCLVHIPITVLVEDESPIFLIVSSITPAIAGIIWLTRHKSKLRT